MAIANVSMTNTRYRLDLFAANASGSAAGATTITYPAAQTGCMASFFHATGVDLSGGVLAAFVQKPTANGNATSGSITLAAPTSPDNRPISGWITGVGANLGAISPRANWTEADEFLQSQPAHRVETQYRSDAFETTASASWTTSGGWAGIAAELKAVGVPAVTAAAQAIGVGSLQASSLPFVQGVGQAIGEGFLQAGSSLIHPAAVQAIGEGVFQGAATVLLPAIQAAAQAIGQGLLQGFLLGIHPGAAQVLSQGLSQAGSSLVHPSIAQALGFSFLQGRAPTFVAAQVLGQGLFQARILGIQPGASQALGLELLQGVPSNLVLSRAQALGLGEMRAAAQVLTIVDARGQVIGYAFSAGAPTVLTVVSVGGQVLGHGVFQGKVLLLVSARGQLVGVAHPAGGWIRPVPLEPSERDLGPRLFWYYRLR